MTAPTAAAVAVVGAATSIAGVVYLTSTDHRAVALALIGVGVLSAVGGWLFLRVHERRRR